MALPKLDQPTYTLTVPSTGNEITYRPFVVKEEKILMMAQQDGDPKAVARATKQVIGNCLVSGDLDVNKLASFDIEYIFLQLRSRSVGETVDLILPCDECETKIEFQINVNDVVVEKKEGIDPNVKLTDDVGIILRWPEVDDVAELDPKMDEIDQAFKLIAICTDSIYDAENVYSSKDVSRKDIEEWLGNLSQDQFGEIRDFFENMPKVTLSTKLTCPKCQHETDIKLEGLQSFFS